MSGNTAAANLPEGEYLAPPFDLPEGQIPIWDTVVRGMPKSHFEPHHEPLVRRYCQLVVMMRALTDWENDVLATDGIDGIFYTTDSGQIKNRPQVDHAHAVTAEVLKLATKLQILPSYSQATATKKKQAAQDRALDSDGEGLLYNNKRH